MKTLLIAILIAALGFGAVAAQDTLPEAPAFGRGAGGVIRTAIEAAANETGLEASDIWTQLAEGATLAEIITGNGGDVQVVIDAAVAAATERVNEGLANGQISQERADALLANLQDVVTQGVNGELRPMGRGRPGRPMGQRGERVENFARRSLGAAILEATDLTLPDLLQQMENGATLGDVITSAGGNVDAIVQSALASGQERVTEAVASGAMTQTQADELMGGLETRYRDILNTNPLQERVQNRIAFGVVRMAAEQTGLEAQAIINQVRGGSSLASILTANGVEVNAFIDDVVAAVDTRLDGLVTRGAVTQERADELLVQLRDHLTARINAAGGQV
jgi:hypothetical protein